MAKGWICLHRQLQDCVLWEKPEPFDCRSAWIDLLLLANHEDKKVLVSGEEQVIRRGQRLVSTIKLADRWHWSVNKVRRYLSLLEKLEMITTKRTPNGTTLTIVNYERFQNMGTTDDTANETTYGITGELPPSISGETQTTIINNENNENNENNNIADKQKHKYGEYNHVLLTDKQRDTLFDEYGEMETLEAIKYLDEYIEMKGYKAKNHYLCIRKWVFDALKKNNKPSNGQRNLMQELMDL